jgi:K+ transporter
VLTLEKPYVPEEARVELHELPAGVTRVILCVGFAEMLSVPEKECDTLQEHRFRNRLRLSAS